MTKTLIAAALLTLSGTTFAGVNSPAIDARQANQAHRIHHGVVSGRLTAGETVRLVHQQAETRRLERRLEADGHLGPVDRARLNHRLDRNSRSIFVQKHDRGRR